MTPSTGDLSLFFQKIHEMLVAMTGAYVDESNETCDAHFEDRSRLMAQKFKSKDREYDNFRFARIEIEIWKDGYLMHQERYTMKLKPLSLE